MIYNVISGTKTIRYFLESLRGNSLVISGYWGKTVQTVNSKNSFVIYDKNNKQLIINGDARSSLLKKMNEIIKTKKVKLEQI